MINKMPSPREITIILDISSSQVQEDGQARRISIGELNNIH